MIIGTGTVGDTPQLSMRSVVFTDNDVEKIQNLPSIKAVAPVGIVPLNKILKRDGFLNWESRPGETMYASTPELLKFFNLELEEGTLFEEGKNEVVINKNVAEIFGTDKPLQVGDIIYLRRVDGRTLEAKVVGILSESLTTNMFGAMANPGIICPIKPYYSTYFGSNAGTVLKRVVDYSVLLAEATDIRHVQVLFSEFFYAGGHGFPEKKLLKNVPLLSGQVCFRVKGLSVSKIENHALLTLC